MRDTERDSCRVEDLLETQRITQNLSQEPASNPNQLQPGFLLVDRYLIQEVIGMGGMGSVYRARDLHFPNVVRLVAVKEMINQAPDPLVRQTIVQNFEREANILATLDHPSIPKIFDYFSHEERSYLVLEYVHGKDLEAILTQADGFFPEDQVIGWAIEICDVLQFLHNHKPEPIIFRDMKPSNIMVNQQNHIMLVDFGIAKMFRSGQKGTMVGTEGYSPPEQYRGEATQRADIYSLGAALHHLLTRKDPRLEAPFSFGERPIRKINPAVSVGLEAIVQTALQYRPEERFSDAEAMKQALLAVAKNTGILHRITLPKKQSESSIKPLWTFRCEDELRGSPSLNNGRVFIGSYDNNLYAVDATSGAFGWKYPTEGGIVGQPAFFQDQVLIGSEDKYFHNLSIRTGEMYWKVAVDGPIRSSAVVCDGRAFFGADDGFLHAVNLNNSRVDWKFDASAPIRSTPAVFNEMVYVGAESGDFFALDLHGELKWRFRAKRPVTSSPYVADGMVFFGSLDSQVCALDAKSGWVIWRFRMGRGTVSSPYHHEHAVVIGSADGFVYCIDANNARENWRFETEYQVSGSPIVHKDAVYCGSADGNMYCIDFHSGRLRWKFPTEGPITGRPLLFNDILYFGSADHMLYALMV